MSRKYQVLSCVGFAAFFLLCSHCAWMQAHKDEAHRVIHLASDACVAVAIADPDLISSGVREICATSAELTEVGGTLVKAKMSLRPSSSASSSVSSSSASVSSLVPVAQ